MVRKTIEQIMKAARILSLNKEEKTRMRENLSLFIQEHPVRNQLGLRPILQEGLVSSTYPFSIINLIYKLRPMPIALIIALFLGGGVSYAAEGSVPGEALYNVKVNINEEVRGALAFSEDAKAKWEARRAERRLEEAEKLAVRGELNEEVRAKIAANFEKHADKMEEITLKMKEKNNTGAADAASQFETSLRVHANILDRLAAEGEVKDLRIKIKARGEAMLKIRTDSEMHIASSTDATPDRAQAAEGKMKAAQNKIDEVKRFFASKKDDLNATTTALVEAKIKAAEDLWTQGKVKLEAKAYGEAFVLFRQTHSAAQEAKMMIEARRHLKLDLQVSREGTATPVKVELKGKGRGILNLQLP